MPSNYPWLVVAPTLGLAAYCLCHVIAARRSSARSPYPALAVSFVPGGLAAAGVSVAALDSMQASTADWIGLLALNAATYSALAWGYFHFVNLSIASLRIRILQEIVEAGGELEARRLSAAYNDGAMIGLRIERLVGGGHFILRDDRYYGGRRSFLFVARTFDALRWCILGPTYCRNLRSTEARPAAQPRATAGHE